MISQLTGNIIDKQPPHLLLDVHGVGYSLACPMGTFYAIDSSQQQPVTLHTHLVIREDSWQLYGFASRDERRLFRILIKINGVGPKLALTILSGMELQEFIQCINCKDHKRLVCIPGIGKKTAERITVEAHDAIAKWQNSSTQPLLSSTASQASGAVPQTNWHEAQYALTALGYKEAEARAALQKLNLEPNDLANLSVETLIRMALKQLATV